ncbi:hypothetical protein [Methylobacterium sp. D54C]
MAWLLTLMHTLRPNTRRQYRAAARTGLQVLHNVASDAALEAEVARALMQLDRPWSEVVQASETIPSPRPPATSARKLKNVTDELLAQLGTELIKRHGHNDAALYAYLYAGCLTGLRPCEWRCARLVYRTNTVTLIVRNAKDGNGRAHGRYRRLVWGNPSAPEIAIIAAWLCALRGRHGQLRREPAAFDVFMRALRDRIRYVGLALWPKRSRRPTLYTVRHVFAARAKQIYHLDEIAALMGHAHDETATEHYARPPRSGSRRLPAGNLPHPHARDVARIRPVFEQRRTFLGLRMDIHHAPRP